MRSILFPLSCVLLIALVMEARSSEAANRGQAVVDQWCRTCHLSSGDRPDANMAPPFEEIVRRPGGDRRFFERFVREDHFPMTMFRLFRDEKDVVVAWLMEIQAAQINQD